MKKYTIEQITTLIGARRIGGEQTTIGWLLTDSRSLCFPEETLFFALRSNRNDGHKYIPDLYKRGVRSFVVENGNQSQFAVDASLFPDANFLQVPSPLAALQRLAERHRDEFDIPIVGITGSNGKTMVKEWLYQILSPDCAVTRSPKSYNSQIGVPLSVWLLDQNTQVGLFEAGISEPDEMEALRDIIQPTIGVLTSLGAAHQENFRSMDEKCNEKLKLFHGAKTIVYNADDDIISRCIRRSGYKGEKIGWSSVNELTPFYIRKTEQDGRSTHVHYIYNGQEDEYVLPFIDEASLECSFACAIVSLRLGLSRDCLAERMAHLEPVAMRLEVKEGQHGCTIINDSYNSDVTSLDIALDFMNRRPDHNGRHHTLILSDIYQSGRSAADLYGEIGKLVVERKVEKFIGIGEELKANSQYIPLQNKHFFDNVQQFVASDVFTSLRDEVVLIKGARSFGFDSITELLEQKVHETILEVNLNAVVDNFNHYRSYMRPETKLVCMVKADAYGAGAVEVAKTLQDHRVDYLAVAVADEGVTLRKNGITTNIMIMNPEMTAFKTMFDYELEPEVYNFRLMDALIRAAEKEGITGYPVHIKLDTGMHRLGFNAYSAGFSDGGETTMDEIDEVIRRLKNQNAIIARSVFSHFVGSDSDDFDNFSKMQFERFDRASSRLQAAFDHKILRHICNSAGIEHFPERHLDMCRLGLGLYGIDPRDNHILHNVSTLKTTILQLRHVPKEETVGYSRKGILSRDSVIAAIPIGYADGLNRKLGRGAGYCLVNGQKAPYVGNICMDVAMVDVTDIPCREGDTVEIFGDNLPVTVLSDILDTIPYEVLTGISNRVKRIYFQD